MCKKKKEFACWEARLGFIGVHVFVRMCKRAFHCTIRAHFCWVLIFLLLFLIITKGNDIKKNLITFSKSNVIKVILALMFCPCFYLPSILSKLLIKPAYGWFPSVSCNITLQFYMICMWYCSAQFVSCFQYHETM